MRNCFPIALSFIVLACAGCKSGEDLTATDDMGNQTSDDLSVPPGDAPVPDVGKTPTCSDGVANGAESDIDCGGASCPACDLGKKCRTSIDCASRLCTA